MVSDGESFASARQSLHAHKVHTVDSAKSPSSLVSRRSQAPDCQDFAPPSSDHGLYADFIQDFTVEVMATTSNAPHLRPFSAASFRLQANHRSSCLRLQDPRQSNLSPSQLVLSVRRCCPRQQSQTARKQLEISRK